MEQKKNQELQPIQSKNFWISKVEIAQVVTYDYGNARKGQQISTMKNNCGKEAALSVLSLIVQRLNDSIKVGNKMDPQDIIEAGYILMTKYWQVKVEQLAHFAHLCKSGGFGEFQRFDQATFFTRLDKYLLKVDEQRDNEYLDSKEQGSDIRQTKPGDKITSILSAKDILEMDRAKKDGE